MMVFVAASACGSGACKTGRSLPARALSLLAILVVLLFGSRTCAATTPVQFLGSPAPVFTSGITIPFGIAQDASGNVYILDYENNILYKQTLQSDGSYVRSTIDSAFLGEPVGLALDSAGNIYVGLNSNSSALLKETLQGNGTYVRSTISTSIGEVWGIAVDSSGNVYATGEEVETNGVTKFIPSGNTYTASSIFTSPGGQLAGLALDSSGNLFAAVYFGNTFYELTPTGNQATTTTYTHAAYAASNGTSAFGIAVDGDDDLFISDRGGRVLLEVPNGSGGYAETVLAIGLPEPWSVALGQAGTILVGVSDAVDEFSPAAVNLGSVNRNIASSTTTLSFDIQPGTVVGAINVVSEGQVNTATGSPEFVNAGGGSCSPQTYSAATVCTVKVKFTPQFTGLQTGAVQILDNSGNLLSTVYLYGTGKAPIAGFSPPSASLFSVTGLGATPLSGPRHPVMDVAGNLYIADAGNNRIVKVAPGGAASVIATPSFSLDNPTAVAIDGAGNLYIADSGNGRVIELNTAGVASVLSTNSLALAANHGVAVDGQGDIFTSDAVNNRILEFPSIGTPHVVSLTGVTLGSADGVAVDGSGNLFIADAANSRIVKVTAGVATALSMGTLSPALANPTDVAVDAVGNLYIADTGNNRIVELSAGAASGIALGTGSYALSDPACAIAGNAEDLYLCDTGNARIVVLNQQAAAALTFSTPSTTAGTRLVNLGNLGLTLAVPASGFNPAFGTANFTLPSAGASGYCPQLSASSSAASTLAAGANCILSVEFAPASGASGVLTDALTLTDNSLGATAATQSIALSGTALATPTVTLTPAPASPISYGQAQTALGVVVTSTAGTPSGTVSLTDSGISLGSPLTLNAGRATLPAQYYLPGPHSFAASYSGDSSDNPAASASVPYTVNKAASTINAPAAPVQVVHGASGTIAVTVTGPYSGAGILPPSGSVSYSFANSSSTVVASGTASIAAATATVPVVNTLASGLYTVTLNYAGDSNYAAALPATATLRIGTLTPTLNWTQPAPITYGTSLSGLLAALATYNATAVPGTFAYTATPTGGSASPVAASSVLGAGSYVLTAAFTPADAATYSAASATVSLTVNKATPALAWPAPAAITYGATLASVLDATASFHGSSVAGSFTYTAAPSLGSASAVTAATTPSAGAYALTATFTPTDAADYVSGGTVSVTLLVNPAAAAVQLTSSINPSVAQNPTTLTATVTSSAGPPAGTVSFLDGTTPLGTATLASGTAALTLSSLTPGAHSLTVAYSGNVDFAAAASPALKQTVVDFTSSPGSTSSASQTVLPGGQATYALSIVPSSGSTFPLPIVLSLSGLPSGADASIAPSTWQRTSATSWTFPANVAIPATTLTIQLPTTTARNHTPPPLGRGLPPLLWAMLLLPFAARMRRLGRNLQHARWLLLAAAGCAVCLAMLGLSGCGSRSGFFGQSPQTYTLTETVTSGALSHSTTLTLTVE